MKSGVATSRLAKVLLVELLCEFVGVLEAWFVGMGGSLLTDCRDFELKRPVFHLELIAAVLEAGNSFDKAPLKVDQLLCQLLGALL
ncbi:hypothetical protein EXIGLDRAFT_721488 [Exidia glandulosa HHB12029]|uniref:Uncharacterized protein n=1 Tax=Exidia glandulosa HHB12029 TaxID=1314781 RepID=A0A165FQU6_EXIGL|nr:hypothetical protein EXIGLDRAFT_721488 [Exidia glandulosa HHB12029]